jgi:hypothetical protein
MGSYSATQIYQMFHSGPGTTGMYHATDGAATQMSTQDDLNNQIIQLNSKMAGAWEGEASQAAMSGAVPLANAAQDATNSLATHQNVLSSQAEAFTTARNSLNNVPSQMPNNTMNDVLAAFGDTGPLDNQISQYASSSQHNVQVYQTYAQTSTLTADQMPQSYGQIPLSNATITVVPPSSTGSSGGYSGMNSLGVIAGGTAEERQAALARLRQAPGTSGTVGGSEEDSLSGAPNGTIDVPPTGNGSWRLPGGPNTPNLNTNSEDWVPTPTTGLNDEYPPTIGLGPNGSSNNNEEEKLHNPNFSGNLNPNGGSGGFGPGGDGGNSAQNAMNSLRPGSGTGSGLGSGPSDATSSSRSGVGMASQATEESMLGGGGGLGPAGAPGEEGGMPGMGGAGGRREEDQEHKSAQYLQEADPDALFGTDEMTAPPVIGE